ncbi:insulinase family protein [Bacillus sp. RD4P76]|uniref:Insulinase family protein n=2 Tax=Bacillus suaedaesalsae TaxID=2810349 RepID=A0ABS2DIV6_9BACI|nr:pitrilysin family protein [Bacillus suaedaesalsae]MBM6618378.1 insulinase family protein [Bacillus suaedaesalsae]
MKVKLDKEKSEVIKGMTVHVVDTKKYKTNSIVLKMRAPLAKEDVTKRALLPYVLQSATDKYPTTSALRTYLDELYGASLQVDLSKKGEYHIITIRIEVANENYLSDQTPLLEQALGLLADVLLRPATEGNSFVSSIVEQEKRSLVQRIQSVFDDKMRYASLRLVEEMCKNEPYSLHVNGIKEDVESITAESLYAYYKKALAEDRVDLYVVGDIDSDSLTDKVSSMFQLKERNPITIADNHHSIEKENEVIEEQDVKQGKLNAGYRTNITYDDADYFALQVMNGIYGAFSHSKLFINVREKASLAYYAASRVESHKGLLMVMSGVDAKNYEQAVTIIKEQMDAMKKGDFTDKEIEQTKAVIKNQILETIDTSRGLIEVLYNDAMAKKSYPVDVYLQQIDSVTKEDIVKAAEKIELDTIYFLKGKGEA